MRSRTLRRQPPRSLCWLAAIVALAALAACGQKGPLTLPGPRPATAPQSPPDAPATDDDEREQNAR